MPFDELLTTAINLPMDELIKLSDALTEKIDAIKDRVKENKNSETIDWMTFKYTEYIKLKPKDITEIIKAYPVEEHPDLYNISLAKGATSVITDEDLFEEQRISSVKIWIWS